jgi:hypothetical protein
MKNRFLWLNLLNYLVKMNSTIIEIGEAWRWRLIDKIRQKSVGFCQCDWF